MMAEDVLAHEDANVDPPPLHTIDTVKVAEYITDRFSKSILAEFRAELLLNPLDVHDKTHCPNIFLAEFNRLMDQMEGFFSHAAAGLREGVSWALPDWVDLEVNEHIVASDVRMSRLVWRNRLKSDVKGTQLMLFIAIAIPKYHEGIMLVLITNPSSSISIRNYVSNARWSWRTRSRRPTNIPAHN